MRTDLLRFLFRGFLGGLLFGASPGKDALHREMIPLVTRDLIELVLSLLQANDGRPRFRPRRQIVERDFPIEADSRRRAAGGQAKAPRATFGSGTAARPHGVTADEEPAARMV